MSKGFVMSGEISPPGVTADPDTSDDGKTPDEIGELLVGHVEVKSSDEVDEQLRQEFATPIPPAHVPGPDPSLSPSPSKAIKRAFPYALTALISMGVGGAVTDQVGRSDAPAVHAVQAVHDVAPIPPVPVEHNENPMDDTDGDGILAMDDRCPHSPSGSRVDKDGCPPPPPPPKIR